MNCLTCLSLFFSISIVIPWSLSVTIYLTDVTKRDSFHPCVVSFNSTYPKEDRFQFLHVQRQMAKWGSSERSSGRKKWEMHMTGVYSYLLSCAPRRNHSLKFRESKMSKSVSSVHVTSAKE